MKRRVSGPSLKRLLLEGLMVAASLIMLFPVVYQAIASFKTKSEINRPLSMPSGLHWDNYKAAFMEGHFLLLFRNSTITVAVTLLVTVLISAIAAYPLARHTAGRYKVIYYFFLSGIMVPFQAGMIPLYKLMNWVGLVDSLLSLIVISAGTCIPMAILIYTGFIRTVPVQLEESAYMDGAGTIRTFFSIVFPLLKPATVSVIILNVIPVWNDFLSPLIFISSTKKKTLPVGMYSFMSERTSDFGPIFAFSVLVSVLPIAVFLLLQRYFYKGITDGAVKG